MGYDMIDLIIKGNKHVCIFSLDSITANYINGVGNDISKQEIFNFFLLSDNNYYINRIKNVGFGVPDFGTDKKCNLTLCTIEY